MQRIQMAGVAPVIDLANIRAIDVHVHAEVSCHDPEDPVMGKFFDAASAYFKAPRERPTIPEIDRAITASSRSPSACSRSMRKRHRREADQQLRNRRASPPSNADIVIPFASIDPHKGKMGAREARDLVENHGVRGFKFHSIMQDAHPADRIAYPIYEVIAEYRAARHLPHRPFGHGHRDARRRRSAPEIWSADADRRCRGRFSRHEDHPGPPGLALGG